MKNGGDTGGQSRAICIGLLLLWQIDQVDQRVDQRFLTTQNFPGGFPAVRRLSLHNKSTQQVSGKVITRGSKYLGLAAWQLGIPAPRLRLPR